MVHLFKVTVEDTETNKSYHLFTNGIDFLLEGAFFNNEIVDAKTLEKTTFKEKIIKSLNIDVIRPTDWATILAETTDAFYPENKNKTT